MKHKASFGVVSNNKILATSITTKRDAINLPFLLFCVSDFLFFLTFSLIKDRL